MLTTGLCRYPPTPVALPLIRDNDLHTAAAFFLSTNILRRIQVERRATSEFQRVDPAPQSVLILGFVRTSDEGGAVRPLS